MIKAVLALLRADDWFVGSNLIDIAKGQDEAPTSLKEAFKHAKRNSYGRHN